MTIQEQIKELKEHINYFQIEEAHLRFEQKRIQDRIDSGKIYGDESAEQKKINARLKELDELINKKHQEVKQLQASLQQTMF